MKVWAPLLILLLAAPLSAEVLEAEIHFQGTGCITCAESLEPRLARIRGVEKVELDLEQSKVRLVLGAGSRARLGPLRLRVTQDGTKILAMNVVLLGVVEGKEGAWTLRVTGPDETVGLMPGRNLGLESGRPYKLSGRIQEAENGDLTLEAATAEPAPQL